MKKQVLIILLIVIMLIVIGLNFNKNSNSINNTITFYQVSCDFNDIRSSQSIKIGNLKIQLTDFFLNAQCPEDLTNISDLEKEDKSCSIRLNFLDENNIQSIIYDWIVYDNNGNILTTNLSTIVKDKKYQEQNKLIKYINKTRFNSTDTNAYSDRIIFSSSISEILREDTELPTSTLVSSIVGIKNDEKYKDDFEQIHILIINPKYQEYGNSDYIELDDTIVEFVIE